MKSLEEFVALFAEQFDETEPEVFTGDKLFREVDEWSSLIGLSLLNMIDKKYGVILTFDELKKTITVQDLYDAVAKKQS